MAELLRLKFHLIQYDGSVTLPVLGASECYRAVTGYKGTNIVSFSFTIIFIQYLEILVEYVLYLCPNKSVLVLQSLSYSISKC